jgi:hypothetical protein
MAFAENQSKKDRLLESWPSHRHHTNGSTHSDIGEKINYNSELDLTHDQTLNSIFVTDSSKILTINEQNVSQDRTTTSMNTG